MLERIYLDDIVIFGKVIGRRRHGHGGDWLRGLLYTHKEAGVWDLDLILSGNHEEHAMKYGFFFFF